MNDVFWGIMSILYSFFVFFVLVAPSPRTFLMLLVVVIVSEALRFLIIPLSEIKNSDTHA